MLWQQLADSEKVVFHGLQLAVQLRVSPLIWEWLGTILPSLGEDGAAIATHTVPWCGDWCLLYGEPCLRSPGHLWGCVTMTYLNTIAQS